MENLPDLLERAGFLEFMDCTWKAIKVAAITIDNLETSICGEDAQLDIFGAHAPSIAALQQPPLTGAACNMPASITRW